MRDDGAPLSIVLQAVPLLSREGVEWTSPEAIRCDYDKHRGQTQGSGEASGRKDKEGLDLDALLEKHLLWAEAGDGGDVTEEVRVAMRTPTTAAGHEVLVSKKGYVDFLHSFATEMQAERLESQASSCELEIQKAKLREL